MSWINLGEVLYILRRRYGSGDADATIRDLCRVLNVELPPEAVVRTAAVIKADNRMSYADVRRGDSASAWQRAVDR
jgi:hypothetical protein